MGPTHKPKAGLFNFMFLSERFDRNNNPKITKPTSTCLRKEEKAGFQCVCTCGPNTRLQIQIENHRIERGIAEMLFSPFFVENT